MISQWEEAFLPSPALLSALYTAEPHTADTPATSPSSLLQPVHSRGGGWGGGREEGREDMREDMREEEVEVGEEEVNENK